MICDSIGGFPPSPRLWPELLNALSAGVSIGDWATKFKITDEWLLVAAKQTTERNLIDVERGSAEWGWWYRVMPEDREWETCSVLEKPEEKAADDLLRDRALLHEQACFAVRFTQGWSPKAIAIEAGGEWTESAMNACLYRFRLDIVPCCDSAPADRP